MKALTGTGALLRLYLRRDRLVAPVWIVLLGALPLLYAVSFEGLYPTAADRQAFYLGTLSAPAQAALVGPIFGSDLGALVSWRSGLVLALVPLAAILTVVRHTRGEEDAGRTELIGSTAVGRYAGLAAAIALAGGAVATTGMLSSLSLWAFGLPVAGSVAYGASVAVVGIVFVGCAAVSAQVASGARVARGYALGVLAAAFVLRAVGDIGSGTLSWFSPIGWSAQVRPFADERWWPLLLSPAAAAAFCATAFVAASRRDLGSGLRAERRGRVAAAPSLSGPVALAWRLSRGTIVVWTVGLALFGTVVGASTDGIDDQLGSSTAIGDALGKFGGTTLEQSFVAAVLSIVGIMVAAYSVSALLRLHAEEEAGLAEIVLATGVSRIRWLAGHLLLAVLGPAWLLLVVGLTIGLTYGSATGDVSGELPSVVGGALGQLPAVWVVTAIGLALFGAVPRFATVLWAVLGGFVAVGQVGSVVGLPQPWLDLSPFTHVPRLPGAAVEFAPIGWLVVIAIVVGMGGFTAFRQRGIRG
ncbi:tetronasin-transport integral membrane protein abc transporter [Rhodococcus sp. B7740]|uniref:ABC transporter permease n=1 Tax=Rhodococcus sp. B7740 TaxID=1564114 RepID=UPI0005D9FD28|nr:ABC transporter permease [Rhodococcus sp. B7740]AJW41347.1 tetronasin-transport integral membrane protein abc transporter [Rhodococcus sp. B7740]